MGSENVETAVNVMEFAEARVNEIASMMDELQSSKKKLASFQKLPHYMRRRAASQNPKRVPRKLQEPEKQGKSKVLKKYKKKNKNKFANKNSSYTWLETHIWHAKRFKMETLWGYRIPIHSNDRKIGTSHRAATTRCMAQDLSYYCCIEMIGVQENLVSKLSGLVNPKWGFSFGSSMFLDGSKEGCCFLYEPNSCPFKAIGPVTFLWEPKPSSVKMEKSEPRKLWIWCHPSFHDDLVQVLVGVCNLAKLPAETDAAKYTFACKLNLEKTKQHFLQEDRYASPNGLVNMNLLRNTLCRHRLMGPTTPKVLSRVLRVADVDKLESSSASMESEDGSDAKRMKLSDPYWWELYYVNNERSKEIHAKQREVWDCLKNIQSNSYTSPRSVVSLTVRDPRNGHHWSESSSHSYDSERSLLNIEDQLTCDIAVSPLWDCDIRNQVTATKMSEMALNEAKQKSIIVPDLGDKENKIPVILIHRPPSNGLGFGWDVIAPLGWSLEFWRSYIKSESLPSGLRDLHFMNLEAGRPNFPKSFPDTATGKQEQLLKQAQGFTEFLRHPNSKRPNFNSLGVSTPFFIRWEILLKDCIQELHNSGSIPQPLKSAAAKIIEIGTDYEDFYVLRNTFELVSLCFRAKKAVKRSDQDLQKLLCDLVAYAENSIKSETQLFKSLVLVKVDCFNKGAPSEHAGLYLLSEEDMLSVKRDRKFGGPVEPVHSCKDEKTQRKKANKLKQPDYIEKSKIDTYIDSCSRKMIGYLSEGGFASAFGSGIGIGHCSSIGFVTLLKQCAEFRLQPLVLWRNQHTFQYRVANIELIEDSM